MDPKEMKMALIEVRKLCENHNLCSECPLIEDGYCGICNDPEFWRTEEWEAEMNEERTVKITRSGVVKVCTWRESEMTVNDQNILKTLEKEINLKKPEKNSNEGFAGRVTIIVELLGDLKGE